MLPARALLRPVSGRTGQWKCGLASPNGLSRLAWAGQEVSGLGLAPSLQDLGHFPPHSRLPVTLWKEAVSISSCSSTPGGQGCAAQWQHPEVEPYLAKQGVCRIQLWLLSSLSPAQSPEAAGRMGTSSSDPYFKLQTSLVIAYQESRHHGDWNSALEEIIMERKGAAQTDTSSQMWCEEEGDL